jgi:hypothetical protein
MEHKYKRSLYDELKILENGNQGLISRIGDKNKYQDFVSEMSKKSLLGSDVIVGDCYDLDSLREFPNKYMENQQKLFDVYSSNTYLQKILDTDSSFLEEGKDLLKKFKGPFAKKSNRKAYNEKIKKFSELYNLNNYFGNSFFEEFTLFRMGAGIGLGGGIIDLLNLASNNLEFAFYGVGGTFVLLESIFVFPEYFFTPNLTFFEEKNLQYLDKVKNILYNKK